MNEWMNITPHWIVLSAGLFLLADQGLTSTWTGWPPLKSRKQLIGVDCIWCIAYYHVLWLKSLLFGRKVEMHVTTDQQNYDKYSDV